jgi:hypothetical protein
MTDVQFFFRRNTSPSTANGLLGIKVQLMESLFSSMHLKGFLKYIPQSWKKMKYVIRPDCNFGILTVSYLLYADCSDRVIPVQ